MVMATSPELDEEEVEVEVESVPLVSEEELEDPHPVATTATAIMAANAAAPVFLNFITVFPPWENEPKTDFLALRLPYARSHLEYIIVPKTCQPIDIQFVNFST